MATQSGNCDWPENPPSNAECNFTLSKAIENVFGESVAADNYTRAMNDLMQDSEFSRRTWPFLTPEEWKLITLCADAGPNAYTMWRAYHAKNTKSPK